MMKKFSKILLTVMGAIFLVSCLAGTIVNAATGDQVNLKAVHIRAGGYGYSLDHYFDSNEVERSKYNIEKVKKEGANDLYYCIKAGVGFGTDEAGTAAVQYTEKGSFLESSVLAQYNTDLVSTRTYLANLGKAAANLPSGFHLSDSDYYKLIYLLDHLYTGIGTNNTTNKQTFLVSHGLSQHGIVSTRSGLTPDTTVTSAELLTDDDVDVIQQLAIWHFTNRGDTGSVGGVMPDRYYADGSEMNHLLQMYLEDTNGVFTRLYHTTFENAVSTATTDAEYVALQRAYYRFQDMRTLYAKLITSAENNGTQSYYQNRDGATPVNAKMTDNSRVKDNNGDGVAEKKNGFYIAGPYSLPKTYSDSSKISFTIVDGNGTDISDKVAIFCGSNIDFSRIRDVEYMSQFIKTADSITVADINSGNMYFAISMDDVGGIGEVNIQIQLQRNVKDLKYYFASPGSQPLIKIETVPVTLTYTGKFSIVKEKDLALRKFITKIGSKTYPDREPQISAAQVEALANGTGTEFDEGKTVSKTHNKDRLEVQPGQLVEYTIRIYNEGDVDGTASTVYDYLPIGLRLAPNNSTNTQYGWSEDSSCTKATSAGYTAIKTSYLADKAKIPAFNGSEVKYIDLKVVCEVTANYSTAEHALKNVAEITEETYTETAQSGGDSTPNNLTSERISNYSVSTSPTGKGYEDDDDYENLYMPAKTFDLALRKYITAYQENSTAQAVTLTGNTSRTPTVVETSLTSGTTATYKHRKDPLVVKHGYYVTYNLTIYNEGELDGRALKIVDQLPKGLTFIEVIDGNFELAQASDYDTTTNRVTLTRKASATAMLPAYQSGQLAQNSETIRIKCRVDANASEEQDTILTNVAWIAKAEDYLHHEMKNEGDDRDSEPGTVPSVSKDSMEHYKGTTTKTEDQLNENIYYPGEQDDDDFEKLVIRQVIVGKYSVILVKEDENGAQLNSQAKFTVDGTEKAVTGQLTIAENVSINSENYTTPDTYTITETEAPDEYCAFDGIITLTVNKKLEDNKFMMDGEPTYTITDAQGTEIPNDGTVNVYLKNGNIYVAVKNYQFDVKLTKRISKVNEENVTNRLNSIDVSKLNTLDAEDKLITTGNYDLTKTPVLVQKGDKVTYTLTVYNEGMHDGYAAEITDDIPEGLEFVPDDTTNQQYEWVMIKENGEVTTNIAEAVKIRTDYLSKAKETAERKNLLTKFGANDGTKTVDDLSSKEIQVVMKVVSDNYTGQTIRNEAAITKYEDKNGNEVEDRDSKSSVWKKYEDDEDYDVIQLKQFDLALRKYITGITNTEDPETATARTNSTRTPTIDTNTIDDEQGNTTATYKHTKNPLEVVTGEIVTYNLTIYNEGQIDGRAVKVVDQLPTGLEFIEVIEGNFELAKPADYDKTTNRVTLTRKSDNTTNLKAFNGTKLEKETITIECKVVAESDTQKDKVLTNVAWIAEDTNTAGIRDRDSEPTTVPNITDLENYKGTTNKDLSENTYHPGQQDDDDFEKVVLKPEEFDLKLIKRITAVNGNSVKERIEGIDQSKLNTVGTDGKIITTGDYTLNKKPVSVSKGDIVTYTFRIYNEGMKDGYAAKITEDVPEGLKALVSDKTDTEIDADKTLSTAEKEAYKFNNQYGWKVSKENGTEVSTDYLSKEKEKTAGSNLIAKYSKTKVDYKEIAIKMQVIADEVKGKTIRNEAAITKYEDKNGNEVEDRDSKSNVWKKYEDDEDYDMIELSLFDLSLRKFITAINDTSVITRIPQVDTKKLDDGTATTATYEHTKTPILVTNNSIVTYTIRVYNEGEVPGYASRIKDDIPDGLEFLPEHETNKTYRWVMLDKDGKETTKVQEAVAIETDYLSEEEGAKRTIPSDSTTQKSNSALLLPYDKETMKDGPDHLDVKVAFKVIEPSTSDRIIINQAQISRSENENGDLIADRDSTPNKWIEGEDDQDIEKIKVQYFDLSLRKWVTQAIVNDNGAVTTTETGHKAEDDPESIVKVEIKDKKLKSILIKFKYKIRVTNEGTIAGYATEIKDYIPSGLKFVEADNKLWKKVDDKTITTDQAKNILLQPGESTEVEVILTWINGDKNLELQMNYAEISKDFNEFNAPDIDSTPNNKLYGEDDIDEAPVVLSIKTGEARIYFAITGTVLMILVVGILLIKKFII